MRRHGGLLVLVLTATACGPVLSVCEREIPRWARPEARGPSNTFVGAACKAPAGEAVGIATANALAAFASELGVNVQSEFVALQQADDSGASESVSARVKLCGVPITVRGAKVVKRQVKAGRGGTAAWVRIAVPPGESARLKRQALGKTALAVTCQTDCPTGKCPWTCPPGFVASVRAAAKTGGLALTSNDLKPGDFNGALEAGAAYILQVKLNSRFEAEYQGEYYAYGNASYEWFDSADRKALAAHHVGETKGGAYSEAGALKTAGVRAGKQLTEALAAGVVKDGQPAAAKCQLK